MLNYYVGVSALIFTVVAMAHLLRLVKQWPVIIGPHSISMSLSWGGLVIAALLAIWGFMQLA